MKKQSTYNPAIHHRRSIRKKGYDYAQEGMYFITLCCQDRAHLFGEVVNGEMILNPLGIIAYNEWERTPDVRPNIALSSFVIMPNHMHGIVVITSRHDSLHTPCGKGELNSPPQGVCNTPPQSSNTPPQSSNTPPQSSNTPPQGPRQTIGAIVRGYKSAVTKQINALPDDVLRKHLSQTSTIWQRNYYEIIIPDEQALQRISNYIIQNPRKWSEDKFYK
jgi:REP element-mobilizing transposase RayT